jgi:hypothetical protein
VEDLVEAAPVVPVVVLMTLPQLAELELHSKDSMVVTVLES